MKGGRSGLWDIRLIDWVKYSFYTIYIYISMDTNSLSLIDRGHEEAWMRGWMEGDECLHVGKRVELAWVYLYR